MNPMFFSPLARTLTRGRTRSNINSGSFADSDKAVAILSAFYLERFPEPEMYILACPHRVSLGEIPVTQAPRRHRNSTITLRQACQMLYRFNVFVLGELLQGMRD